MPDKIKEDALNLLKQLEEKQKLDVNEYCLALALTEYRSHIKLEEMYGNLDKTNTD